MVNNSKKKICLGTAQLGSDYGINNTRGVIPEAESVKLLSLASEYGIEIVDTASGYGKSERIIGDFLVNHPEAFKVISKFAENEQPEESVLDKSLEKLKIRKVYGYLIHSFDVYKSNPSIFDTLLNYKHGEKVEKIGFSLYYPHELDCVLSNNLDIDMVQIPFSIFDQRFSPYFSVLKDKGIEVFVRSVYLQGLVFKNPDCLEGQFIKFREKLNDLNLLSEELKIPIGALCLNFAILNKHIDKVIVGIDGLEHLRKSMDFIQYSADIEKFMDRLANFQEEDEQIILPFNWSLNKQGV
ncbi:aldo/keto reductase [Candidatus Omnitrophota bacterium]